MVDSWFLEGAEAAFPKNNKVEIRDGNLVNFFIDYQDYYNDLAINISATENEQDAILITGWDFNPDAPIALSISPDVIANSTVGDYLKLADKRKVAIRAIIFGHPDNSHLGIVSWFSKTLSNGGAIHDQKCIFPAGAHHQKTVVIFSKGSLTCYCGGMDIAPDRIKTPTGFPWHDVQVKIEGLATLDVFLNFYNRWRDQEDKVEGQKEFPRNIFNCTPNRLGNSVVQVVKTFPNLTNNASKATLLGSIQNNINAFDRDYSYSFARKGETTLYKALLKAIKKTEFNIYLEEQYLVESELIKGHELLTDVLRSTINKPSFKKFIILTNGVGTVHCELFQSNLRRNKFWSQLGSTAQQKTEVWQFSGGKGAPYWQHSKIWIFDDAFALVSSANSNRRGYSSDSEIGVTILENIGEGIPFPQKLRTKLWMKHLNAKKVLVNLNDVLDFDNGYTFWTESDDTILTKLDLSIPDLSKPDMNLLDNNSRYCKSKLGSWASLLKSAASTVKPLRSLDLQWNNILDPDGT